jgi:probable HAF family extracellular repeat protein
MPGQGCATANAINARNQVVGGSCNALGDGWLWEDGTMYDLHSLAAPSSIRLAEAHASDDRGEIVCRGVLANGDVHLMLLVPSALAAGEGLTSRVPAGSPPAAPRSDTHAALNHLVHASRFWNSHPRTE